MQKRSAKWAKTKTLEAKDAPIDALPACLLSSKWMRERLFYAMVFSIA
jgi:hypothetical protein